MARYLDPLDLIVGVIALDPVYRAEVTSFGLSRAQFTREVLAHEGHPALAAARICPDRLHGASPRFEHAIDSLIAVYGVLRLLVPGDDLLWGFPGTPQRFYERTTIPRLPELGAEQIADLVERLGNR